MLELGLGRLPHRKPKAFARTLHLDEYVDMKQETLLLPPVSVEEWPWLTTCKV